MAKYNPNIHHRKSIRLKGYDYSQAGLYFVTICVHQRKFLFGNITNGEMQLNDAGRMVEKWYSELENKFPEIRCHQMIVMPNHFHCIIENTGNVGADLRVSPNVSNTQPVIRVSPNVSNTPAVSDETAGSPLHSVVQWFKTMTTNEYIRGVKNFGWIRFEGKLWQRNYWEHIIRNEQSYHSIGNYIINNPANWQSDNLFK